MTSGTGKYNILVHGPDALTTKADSCYCDGGPCDKVACPYCGDVYGKCDFWLDEKGMCEVCEVQRGYYKSTNRLKWKGPGYCKWCFSPNRLPRVGNSRRNGRNHDDWPDRLYHKICWTENIKSNEAEDESSDSDEDQIVEELPN